MSSSHELTAFQIRSAQYPAAAGSMLTIQLSQEMCEASMPLCGQLTYVSALQRSAASLWQGLV